MGKFQDLSGQKFGRLTVMSRVDDYITTGGKRKICYKCICDCGNESIVFAERLRSGHTLSCGCLAKEKALQRINSLNESGKNIKDLTGRKFGRLTVENILPVDKKYKNSSRRWHCRCECGNEIDVFGQSLLTGLTRSCGCLNNEVRLQYNNLSGKFFGYWTVVSRADNLIKPSGKSEPAYLCRCQCGTERIVLAQSLKNGTSYSCGCYKGSLLELLTSQCLLDIGCNYKFQVKFDDLVGLRGYPLSYDFGIYDDDILKGLIECQGQQHYKPVEYFGGNKQFEKQQKYDKLKKFYAMDHYIPLLEIPYSCKTYEEIFPYVSTFCDLINK